ncbi:type VII secretion target [Streptomyces sp. NPDC054765]
MTGIISVDTDGLKRFADYLKNDTVSEISRASDGVHSLNGGDVDAFGVLLAQALGVPARIAMAVAADHLDDLAHTMADVAKSVQDTASVYEDIEQASVQRIRNELQW